MLKNIILTTLICISALVSGSIFHPATAAASNMDNPKKYTFLFFIQGLNDNDLNGSGLPNMKKLKSEGICYQQVTKMQPTDDRSTLTSILGLCDDQLLLTRTLADNKIDCLAVDGTGTITASLAKNNRLLLISEPNDQLAIDKFLDKMNEQPNQFAAIFLNDVSQTDLNNKTSNYQKWSLADNQVGRVINYLIRIDKLVSSTIIITGGGSAPPLLVYNGGTNQQESFYHCRQLDIAPTLCKMYGIIPPAAMPGHILYESLPPTSSGTLTSNLKHRVSDLQKECQQYNQQISLFEKEQRAIQTEKVALKKAKADINQIITEKDSTIQNLSSQISTLKILGAAILIILLAGYIFLYRWLRKRYLIF